MKSVVTSLIAALAFCFAAALPSAASAEQQGGGTVVRDPEPRGPWKARVRWTRVHEHNGVVYTYTYADIIGPTQQSCDQQLQAAATNPNVSVVQYCQPM